MQTYDAIIVLSDGYGSPVYDQYNRIKDMTGCEKIVIITNKDNYPEYSNFTAEELLPFDKVYSCIESILGEQKVCVNDLRGLAGWYYQQFLKMVYAINCKDEYYLLWDADTLPCREIRMLCSEDVSYLDIKDELREGYFETIDHIFPELHRVSRKSFVSEHMMIRTQHMRELIKEIEENVAVKGRCFWEKILFAVGKDRLAAKSFSEFETYGMYVINRFPERYRIREWHAFRTGGDFFDPGSITERDYKWLGQDFDAISFEAGHHVREDRRNLFDNISYQEKVNAGKLLQAAQGDYIDEYVRGWENDVNEMPHVTDMYREEYAVYDQMGDKLKDRNLGQAFLCWQHAAFLCNDEKEKKRITDKLSLCEKKISPVSIVIVSYNSMQLMEDCINSIRSHCGRDEYNIIVVDNASDDGVRAYLEQQRDIILLCNDDNKGFPAACNQGVVAAPDDEDILFLNNDTRMTHNALFWLRMALYEADDVGACGCISNYAGIGQMIELLLARPENYTAYARIKNIPVASPYVGTGTLCGYAMLVRRSVIDITGGMDEAFTPGYYEDTDLSFKIRSLGYRLMICQNSFIYHAGGQSFGRRNDLERIAERNLEYLMKKWAIRDAEHLLSIEEGKEEPVMIKDELYEFQTMIRKQEYDKVWEILSATAEIEYDDWSKKQKAFYWLSKLERMVYADSKEHGLLGTSEDISTALSVFDAFKKQIQRLEWWPEYELKDLYEFIKKYHIHPVEIVSVVRAVTVDPDQVLRRIRGEAAIDHFYREPEDANLLIKKYADINERFCFITCCNDQDELNEMYEWIDRLYIPEGIEIEMLEIQDAASMCSGYNEAMHSSSAHYKVYLHQDVRIINPWFIYDVLETFDRNPDCGMIGMMGAKDVPASGIMWETVRFGAVVHTEFHKEKGEETYEERNSYGADFSAALTDGFLIVTRHDIEWRDDLFKGWDFYDASVSMEFRKRGYKIIIPEQNTAWCLHDFGQLNWSNYRYYQRIFIEEYLKDVSE